jgi:N-acetylglucosamine kinase-like BadF-type ATPase
VTCVLGLDIGGSATRGRAAVNGETVAETSGPAANVTAVGEAAAAEVLRSVIAQLRGSLPRAPDAVCAGVAGQRDPRTRRVAAGDAVAAERRRARAGRARRRADPAGRRTRHRAGGGVRDGLDRVRARWPA